MTVPTHTDRNQNARYRYYRGHRVAATVAALFGVILAKPYGQSHYYFDEHVRAVYKNLGAIDVYTATGRIVAWPNAGLTPAETEFLIGAAEDAFRVKPSKAGAWVFRQRKSGSYWRCFIAILVKPEHDAVAEVMHASMDFESRQVANIGNLADALADGSGVQA